MLFLRMPFLELFSSSFLLIIAIVIILIGVVFAYISYRMSDQDHKISSMVSLVSSMAEELQFFRSKMNGGMNQFRQEQEVFTRHNGLIEVSDDEYENHSDSESESESDSEPESEVSENEVAYGNDTDTDSDSDNYSHDEESKQDNEYTSEVDDMTIEKDIDINAIKSIHLDEEDLNPLEEELDSLDDHVIDLTKLPIPHIDESQTHHEIQDIKDTPELKTISITEEMDESYKKMSLPKLRTIVVEKGLVNDASKLKKNELLKLLGDE